ncbi:tetratricopeptide repeat protein [Candidatus Hydrogenedentota bacterium]
MNRTTTIKTVILFLGSLLCAGCGSSPVRIGLIQESVSLSNAARNDYRRGRLDAAEAKYNRALDTALMLDRRDVASDILNNIGKIKSLRGDAEGAQEDFAKALDKAERVDDRSRMARSLVNMADSLVESGAEEAGELYTRATELAASDDNEELETFALLSLIEYDADEGAALLGRLGKGGVKSFVEMAAGSNGLPSRAKACEALGAFLESEGDVEAALTLYEGALQINKNAENGPAISRNLARLGDLFLKIDKLDDALDHYERAVVVNGKLGARGRQASNLSALAGIFEAQGDRDAAESARARVLRFSAPDKRR